MSRHKKNMGKGPCAPSHFSRARSRWLLRRLLYLRRRGRARLSVGLAVAFDGAYVKSRGGAGVEGWLRQEPHAVDGAWSVLVRSSMREGSMPFRQSGTAPIQGALGCGVRLFIGRMLADDNEFGGGLAVEGEGDIVEAALGLVVDADGTLLVALEGEAAEIAGLGWRWGSWLRDVDGGVGRGMVAEVVDYVAGDGGYRFGETSLLWHWECQNSATWDIFAKYLQNVGNIRAKRGVGDDRARIFIGESGRRLRGKRFSF